MMSWVKEALAGLKSNQTVTVQPIGGSMRGRIESGQLVTLERVDPTQLKVNDAVFVKWGDNYLLHLITNIRDDQIEIGNNLGKINGWISRSSVLGRVIAVCDEKTMFGQVEQCCGLSVRIRLDSGETVTANLSKQLARDLMRIAPGDRMRVGGFWNRQYRILGPEAPPDR